MPRKKVIVSVLICLLVVMTAVPVYASNQNGNASPWALYYSYASAKLSIASDGTATITGSITGIPGTTTKTTVHLYLQQYKNGDWEDVDDWLDSGETVSRTLTKSKSVEKGYKYRAKASCYAYSGTKCEHVTKYSPEVNY